MEHKHRSDAKAKTGHFDREGKEAQGTEVLGAPAFSLSAGPPDPNMGRGAFSLNGVPSGLLAHLREREGYREDVYPDSLGVPTVGIGHRLTKDERKQYPVGTVVDRAQIVRWAAADFGAAYGAAREQAAEIGVSDEGFIHALVSVNFQLGTNWYRDVQDGTGKIVHRGHKKTWALLMAHDWEEAAREAARSKWNAQTPKRVKDFQRAIRALEGSAPAKPEAPVKEAPDVAATVKSARDETNGDLLEASIGRGGKNRREDLRRFGRFLLKIGAPFALIRNALDPARNGDLIARYQREVLRFRNPDGRIDPGGKTITAILEQQGREIVAGWYTQPDSGGKNATSDEGSRGAAGNAFGPGGKSGIAPVISEDDFYSQLAGPNAVPLSFLKKNMKSYSSDSLYRNNGCWQTCRYILIQSGNQPQGKNTAEYMIEASFSGSKNKGTFKKWISGIDAEAGAAKSKLDDMLEAGMPVVVGVNRNSDKHNARWTNYHREGGLSPTDHYVVIVGRVVMEDGRIGYRYFDPGRTRAADGCAATNLLIVENGYIRGKGYGSVYTISEVRNTTSE